MLASSLAKGWRLILALINALILLVHCTKGMECVVRVSSRWWGVSSRWWGSSLGPTLTKAARETTQLSTLKHLGLNKRSEYRSKRRITVNNYKHYVYSYIMLLFRSHIIYRASSG